MRKSREWYTLLEDFGDGPDLYQVSPDSKLHLEESGGIRLENYQGAGWLPPRIAQAVNNVDVRVDFTVQPHHPNIDFDVAIGICATKKKLRPCHLSRVQSDGQNPCVIGSTVHLYSQTIDDLVHPIGLRLLIQESVGEWNSLSITNST